jgi:hypothetical protein
MNARLKNVLMVVVSVASKGSTGNLKNDSCDTMKGTDLPRQGAQLRSRDAGRVKLLRANQNAKIFAAEKGCDWTVEENLCLLILIFSTHLIFTILTTLANQTWTDDLLEISSRWTSP